MSDIAITFAIIAAAVVLFVWNRVPVALVAIATPLALYLTGVLDAGDALAGLGDPVVIFIAALLVVSAGLEVAGVTTWAGQILVEKAGTSRARLLVSHDLARRRHERVDRPHRYDGRPVAGGRRRRGAARPIPLAAPHAARVCVECRRPADARRLAGECDHVPGRPGRRSRCVWFLRVRGGGDPATLGVMAISLALGQRLLPERGGIGLPRDFGAHARTLVEQYRSRTGCTD